VSELMSYNVQSPNPKVAYSLAARSNRRMASATSDQESPRLSAGLNYRSSEMDGARLSTRSHEKSAPAVALSAPPREAHWQLR
jgi:hypothetical protein